MANQIHYRKWRTAAELSEEFHLQLFAVHTWGAAMARGPVGAAAVSSSDGCSTAAALMQGQASTPASFRVRADASDSLFALGVSVCGV